MSAFRLRIAALLIVLPALGCGQPAGKPIPPPTEAEKAELDKMHAEKMKEAGATPDAPKQ